MDAVGKCAKWVCAAEAFSTRCREVGLGDQISVIGVDNKVDREHDTGDAHTGGSTTLLTGTISTKHPGFEPPYGGVTRVYGSSISLDQQLARAFGQPGDHVLGIRGTRGYETLVNRTHQVISRTGPTDFTDGNPSYRNAVFAEDDPSRVHRRFFGDAAADQGNDASLRAARGHAMDFLDRELVDAASRSSISRRRRLDDHRAALADARVALERGAPGAACIAPMLGEYGDVNEGDNSRFVPQLSDAQIANSIAALACDATRVLMLQYAIAGGGPNHRDGEWFFERYGFDLAQSKRDLSVGLSAEQLSYGQMNTHAISHATGESAFPYMYRYTQWHAEQLAKLALGLQAVETDRGTLLDDTIIVWFSENGQTPHDRRNTPFVIIGGTNWVRPGLEMDPDGTTQVPLLRALGRVVSQDTSFSIGDDGYAGGMERYTNLLR